MSNPVSFSEVSDFLRHYFHTETIKVLNLNVPNQVEIWCRSVYEHFAPFVLLKTADCEHDDLGPPLYDVVYSTEPMSSDELGQKVVGLLADRGLVLVHTRAPIYGPSSSISIDRQSGITTKLFQPAHLVVFEDETPLTFCVCYSFNRVVITRDAALRLLNEPCTADHFTC